MGDGSSPLSLSHAGIGRLIGCQLPDAILHGKRSLRPRSRAVQRLAAAGLLSEAFQLAWAGVCGTGLRTRSRHVCDGCSASSPLSARSATAFGSALAWCHGSRLFTLRLLFAHRSAVSFLTSPTLRKVFTGPAETPCPPRCARSLCLAFRRLSFGGPLCGDRQSRTPVLMRSSNRLPSGNCDSPGLETLPGYLTELGTVSHRPSLHSSFFAFTDDARTSPEELVNPASPAQPCGSAQEGLRQPAWLNLSPVTWDYP
jgi:hypothetical protein